MRTKPPGDGRMTMGTRTMKSFSDGTADVRKPATLLEYILHAQFVVYGTIRTERRGDASDEYRLEILQVMHGEIDPFQPVSVDPACLKRTVRFGFQPQREVVVFSLGGGSDVSGDDLVLPVILDPINNEKYVKIPPELTGKSTLRKTLARKWGAGRNRPPKPATWFDTSFVLFEEFKTNLGDLCRDLR